MKQRIPALVLLVLAPGIGEYLLGNLPLSTAQPIAALPLLVALYGGGAVAVREISVRIGGGWPTVVLFALAYGLIEEGLVTQSLFNQQYAVLELLDYGVLPGVGVSLPWALFALTLHSVWSITVPIVLVELLFPDRRGRPWLGRLGLIGALVLYAVGAVALNLGTMFTERFVAAPGQLFGVAALAVLGVAAAVVAARRGRDWGRDRGRDRDSARPVAGRPWPVWSVALAALLAGCAFYLLYILGGTLRVLPAPVEAGLTALLLLGAAGAVLVGSRRSGWSTGHEWALAAGAVLTYSLVGQYVQISQYGLHLVGTVVHLVLVAGAVALLWVARRRAAAAPRRDSAAVG